MTTEESLVEENEQLKKVVEMLQSEFKPGKKTIPEPARVEAVCKKILKNIIRPLIQKHFGIT